MKFLVMLVVAVLAIGLCWFLVMENAGKKHHAELKPPAQSQEAKGEIVEFRTVSYEPNTGSARAYAVVRMLDGKKTYRVGRAYFYSSPTGEEKWSVKSRKTVWDESKGDSAPLIPPYWAVK